MIAGTFLANRASAQQNADDVANEVEPWVEQMLEAYGVPGLALTAVRGQEILLARGYGRQADNAEPYTADTPCHLFSATKALTSFVVAALIADAQLDLETTLDARLQDPPPHWAGIPLRSLLNHTSGITTIVDKADFERLMGDPTSTNADIVDVLKPHPLEYPAGSIFRYRQSGYAIFESILSDQLDSSWPEIVEARLTRPAGAGNTVHAAVAEGEREIALLASAGGYRTTAADMAKIFLALNSGRPVSPDVLEKTLYDSRHLSGDYSLGSVLQTIDGKRTVGHSGGGARANVRYVPSDRVGVAVFTDARDNSELALTLADMVVRKLALGQEPLLPISVPLFRLRNSPAEEIIERYTALRSKAVPAFDLTRAEWTLNRLGYMLLNSERVEEAITLFQFNVTEHPSSANTHDSLGEAYFKGRRPKDALQSYAKALELDPGSHNAMDMIKRIQEESLQAPPSH